MKILLNNSKIGIFLGQQFEVTETCVLLEQDAVNYDYNASNTTVIDADVPLPPLSNCWKWEADTWVCIDQEAVDAYNLDQKNAFNLSQKRKREATYTVESDPIYFLSQRGEATQQEWLDKIAEIKARLPYQE